MPPNAIPSPPEIRSHFPALERCHNGFPVAYFDGPGGTQVPRVVAQVMVDYLYHHNANTHWAYPSSEETDAALDNARQMLGEFLNASPTEIAFGANMTTLTFHLARALGREYSPGDEIVVTELDHHANIAPWTALEAERGITVHVARMVPETGQLDWDDVERLIGKHTKLVAIGAASNALGTIVDVRRATAMARAVGAQVFVDGVHYAPHTLTDVRALDCDFYACSAYKFYGPHVGILFGKYDLLQSLDLARLLPAPEAPPERAETGTLNHEGIVGAAAAVDWLASLGSGATLRSQLESVYEELERRCGHLFIELWEGLASIEGVTLYGPPPDVSRTPTAAFVVRNLASTQVSRLLSDRGVFTSHGDFYALTVIERLGLAPEGLVRAGCACYTTSEEIARLVDGLREIAEGRA